jgi:hypothetical protein
MWPAVHWFFMYYLQPNALFHTISSISIALLQWKAGPFKQNDIVPAVGLLGMYICYTVDPIHSIPALAYHPYWVVVGAGFRKRTPLIVIGSIWTAFYLFTLPLIKNIVIHILMNVCFMLTYIKKDDIGLKALGMVHFCAVIFNLLYDSRYFILDATLRDVLFATSSVFVYHSFKLYPDVLSLLCLFTSPLALCAWFLHAGEMFWYQFFKNNHFKRVKGSYTFVFGIFVIVFSIYSDTPLFTHVPDPMFRN